MCCLGRNKTWLHDQECTPNIVQKKSREKAKSFDEIVFVKGNSTCASGQCLSGFAVSSRKLSLSSAFDHTNTAVKKDYPLPLPLQSSSPEPSTFTRSTDSSSNDSDCEPFGSFRAYDESKANSWSRTHYSPCKASITCASSPMYPILWGKSFESPTESNENCNHPIHPLPLPPISPRKPSGSLESNWKKGKLLRRGTSGNVYAGFNSETGKLCAIKEVRIISHDQSSKECLSQLNQEIEVLSQLSHPNIVQYHGSERGENKLSLYLEYVSGSSLQELLQEYGPFGEQVIQSYTRKILSALVYLHERNTAHRNIKGANILVSSKGEVKLADFGMAKHMASCSSVTSFRANRYWLAPEVNINAGSYSIAEDIWSFGCTALEMARTKPTRSQYEGVAAIFGRSNGKDVPEIPNSFSDEAKSFIELCLQRNPFARPTAAQLLHHPFIQGKQYFKRQMQ